MSKAFEDEMRKIVNHLLAAYKNVHLGLLDAMYDNSEAMIACLRAIWYAGLLVGLYTLRIALWIMRFMCALARAARHIIVLAFYPGIKLYFILRVRRGLMRDHPEYIARE